jgi:hypothetical protein
MWDQHSDMYGGFFALLHSLSPTSLSRIGQIGEMWETIRNIGKNVGKTHFWRTKVHLT